MKLEVYGEKKEDDVVRLRLENSGDDSVNLWAVDENGNHISGGLILWFESNGSISLSNNINPKIGLPLDAEGMVEHS